MVTERAPLSYHDAGVDIDAVSGELKQVGAMAAATHTDPRVLSGLGGFGALFAADFRSLHEPVLVSSTDGVGTKLLVARRAGRFDTLGSDLVNHCIDDILVMGALPLFFLDYIAAGHFPSGRLTAIAKGFADACAEQGVALIGGESAEMPGVYSGEDFDLAGFIVGVVDRAAILGPERVRDGDLLLGLTSSGLHTNGYSLAQKILFEREQLGLDEPLPGMAGSLAQALLAVHRCYLPCLRGLLGHPGLHAMAHITGGGFTDNLPRVLPAGLGAVIDRDAWTPPQLFAELAHRGPVEREEMDRTFNMGLGMLLVVDPAHESEIIAALAQQGERALPVGRVQAGSREVGYVGSSSL